MNPGTPGFPGPVPGDLATSLGTSSPSARCRALRQQVLPTLLLGGTGAKKPEGLRGGLSEPERGFHVVSEELSRFLYVKGFQLLWKS